MNGLSDSNFATWSAVSLPSIPSWPGTHISWNPLSSGSFARDWWQSQTNLELIW
jgi:hypothetical protein